MTLLAGFLLVVGVVIVAALAFYAGRLLSQLQAQRQAQARAMAEQQQKMTERNNRLLESIVLIARAMDAQQCESSEGCLRLWHLLNALMADQQLDVATAFPGIQQMYDVVKDMPTHEARKKYSKAEIRQLDWTRMKAEARLEAEIAADVKTLLTRYSDYQPEQPVFTGAYSTTHH